MGLWTRTFSASDYHFSSFCLEVAHSVCEDLDKFKQNGGILDLTGANLVEKYTEVLSTGSVSMITTKIAFYGGTPKIKAAFWKNLPQLKRIDFRANDLTLLDVHTFDEFIARVNSVLHFQKIKSTDQLTRMKRSLFDHLKAAGKITQFNLEGIEIVD